MNHPVYTYDDLRPFLGLSRINLWSCPDCVPDILASAIAPSPHYPWGVVLLCGVCGCCWVVCKECPNVKRCFRTPADMLSHHRLKHRIIPSVPSPTRYDAVSHHHSYELPSITSGVVAAADENAITALNHQDSAACSNLDLCNEQHSALFTVPSTEDIVTHGRISAVSSADLRAATTSTVQAESMVHVGTTPSSPTLSMSALNVPFFDERNSHKFLLIDIPKYILESINEALLLYPITQYEVICSALKQVRLFKAFHLLFPPGKDYWKELVSVLKLSFLNFQPHLDPEEINVTALVTDGPMTKDQQPHMDYSWETILLPSRRDFRQNPSKSLRASAQIPFTGHMPVSPDGAYIYLWSGPGVAVPYHIEYGKMLIIRGDVVHSGGLPSFASSDKLYRRVHFYFPLVPLDIPPNGIYLNNFDGQSFSRDYMLP